MLHLMRFYSVSGLKGENRWRAREPEACSSFPFLWLVFTDECCSYKKSAQMSLFTIVAKRSIFLSFVSFQSVTYMSVKPFSSHHVSVSPKS